MKKQTAAKWLVTLTMGALLAGCATTRTPETIEERVQAKWQHLVAGEYEAAYAYYSPGYRSVVTVGSFVSQMERRTVPWTSADLKDFGPCEEETCTARVAVGYRVLPLGVPAAKPFDGVRVVHEEWIFADGGWFFVPKQ
ncbi:MAG: hypothetical protein AAGA23_18530 [Pseudomonadota bacterium]